MRRLAEPVILRGAAIKIIRQNGLTMIFVKPFFIFVLCYLLSAVINIRA
jgi:hypothetical protein